MSRTMEQDWETPITKAEANLHLWSSRKLTIRGRALLARTFGIAAIIYMATCFTIPKNITARFTKAIFTFLWRTGVEYVKRTTIQKSLEEGGLAIPNIELLSKVLKTKMALKLVNKDRDSNWFLWIKYQIGAPIASVANKWASLRDNKSPHRDPSNLPPLPQRDNRLRHTTKSRTRKASRIQRTNFNEIISAPCICTRTTKSRNKMGIPSNNNGNTEQRLDKKYGTA